VADEASELIEAPDTCGETIEYDNIIEEHVENEPDEDLEIFDAPANWLDLDQTFARFERNYRARRIRELTVGTLHRKRATRRKRAYHTEAAA
jgi:hypothetical protein